MNISKLLEIAEFEVLNNVEEDAQVDNIYCCDLLSVVMSKLKENDVWITVMGNINSIAVASLSECRCIILSENMEADEVTISRANMEDIMLLKTSLSTYDVVKKIQQLGI